MEELNNEYEIPQDSWDILDKAKPTAEPTSSNPAFITEGPPPEDNDEEVKRMSPPPPPDTVTTCEEIPLISAKNDIGDNQDGLFSQSTAKQNCPSPSFLIMGASPSPPSKSGFKPLIEVVSSTSQQNDSQECSQPSSNPPRAPIQPSLTTISESASRSTKKSAAPLPRDSSSKLAWSTVGDKTYSAPESTELEGGGQWAVSTSSTNPKPLQSKPESRLESGGLLIEEIDDDDFNVGRLPLTVDEQAAIVRTDAALEGIKDRPISELSEEERVWQLAASAGSTSLEGGAELDKETKARLRERLGMHGLIDKTSLKF